MGLFYWVICGWGTEKVTSEHGMSQYGMCGPNLWVGIDKVNSDHSISPNQRTNGD